MAGARPLSRSRKASTRSRVLKFGIILSIAIPCVGTSGNQLAVNAVGENATSCVEPEATVTVREVAKFWGRSDKAIKIKRVAGRLACIDAVEHSVFVRDCMHLVRRACIGCGSTYLPRVDVSSYPRGSKSTRTCISCMNSFYRCRMNQSADSRRCLAQAESVYRP